MSAVVPQHEEFSSLQFPRPIPQANHGRHPVQIPLLHAAAIYEQNSILLTDTLPGQADYALQMPPPSARTKNDDVSPHDILGPPANPARRQMFARQEGRAHAMPSHHVQLAIPHPIESPKMVPFVLSRRISPRP